MVTLNKSRLLTWLIFLSLAFCTSCNRRHGDQYSWVNPPEVSQKAMQLYDANRDGRISGVELDQVPGLKAALGVLETDQEQGITPEQLSDRIQQWIESKIGRISINCIVTHNGQPLEGATVKFISEKFLADVLTETATGITDKNGKAVVSFPTLPEDDMPLGVSPGIYRVEITKDGENIPAKYNTATVLGQEVSGDNPEMQKDIKFDLQY